MRTVHRVLLASFLATALAGCGPLQSPMPPRLTEDAQKDAERAWNDAFTPPDRHDHQALLDAFLVSQAYQIGVDRLTFRSEKKLQQGLIVMEIQFERLKPDDDRFEVSVYDNAGKRIRYDRFTRADVEQAHNELFPQIPAEEKGKQEPAEWAQKRAIARKRIEAVEKLLPKAEDKKQPDK